MIPPYSSVVVIGAGGHAVSVAESVIARGYEIDFFIDESATASFLLGYSVLNSFDALQQKGASSVVVAVGDNQTRYECVARVRRIAPNICFPTIVHPSASVASSAQLGEGTVVMQAGVVGACSRIGAFCIVNTGASIDHETTVCDYVSLAPGAVTGGRVGIGTRSAIGIGAVVRHDVTVGADVVVGAASYVHHDLPDAVVAFGTPASIQRSRRPGDPYLK